MCAIRLSARGNDASILLRSGSGSVTRPPVWRKSMASTRRHTRARRCPADNLWAETIFVMTHPGRFDPQEKIHRHRSALNFDLSYCLGITIDFRKRIGVLEAERKRGLPCFDLASCLLNGGKRS